MARFLIDEDSPRSYAAALNAAGHDAVHDAGLTGSPDDVIFAFAKSEGRILVTADKGFSNILHFPPGTHPGVVVARLPTTLSLKARVAIVVSSITDIDEDELAGATLIVSPTGTRLRSK